jgi:hypothetical protein
MLRTVKATLAAAALTGVAAFGGHAALAQWGYGPSYLHSPGYASPGLVSPGYGAYGPGYGGYGPGYGGPGFSGYNFSVGSRYSLYQPSVGPSGLTPYASPYGCGCGYGDSAYAPAMPPMAPYGGLAAPYAVRRHGKLEYDVYGPYGKQEIEYRYHRNGTVSVDVDD